MEIIHCYYVIVKLFNAEKKSHYTYVNVEFNHITQISYDEIADAALQGLSDLKDYTKEIAGITYINPKDFGKVDFLPVDPYKVITL